MSDHNDSRQVRRRGGGAVAALLWLVLLVSGAANAAGTAVGLDSTSRVIAGGVAVVCIAGLVTYYARRGRN
ncbi:hypothetical protein ACFWY9_36930 [Amycolatopsis sp. NPDC059027]|uniref:hypothetical protein n=1 Tax=unclassified Amycolatopsis TaxID=2618356 RepID=UPI003670FA7E